MQNYSEIFSLIQILCKLFLSREFIFSDAIDTSKKNNENFISEESISELVKLEDRTSLRGHLKNNNFNGTSDIIKTKYSNFDTEGTHFKERIKNTSVNSQSINTDINKRCSRVLGEKKSTYLKTNQNSSIKTLTTQVKESEVIYLN